MAQNNMMGGGMAPPPASPANPTALNFQSDPNMRQQFKGFMSGLSNRPMPQPMAPQPMPAPMPMYTPASDIDIFEPVQGFAKGGGVTFSSGDDYTAGGGISISSDTVQGGDTFGGEGNDVGLNDPYETEMIQTGKNFLDNFGSFTSGDSGAVAFGVGSRPRVDLTTRSSPDIPSSYVAGDALSNEINKRTNASNLSNQAQAEAAMGLGRGFGASGTTQSVTGAPTASGYDDFGINALNLLGGSDLLGFSSPYDVGEAAGQQVAQGQPSGTAPIERERTVAGMTNRVADSGFGPGEVYRAKGAGPTEQEIMNNIADASGMRTTVTLGLQDPRFGGMAPPLDTPDAVTVSSLDQLARRAQLSPGSFGGEMMDLVKGSKIPGASSVIGPIVAGFGASQASQMYDDIVNKGFIPGYDSRGQIVVTRDPVTGQYGRGSVRGREAGYTPPPEGNAPGETVVGYDGSFMPFLGSGGGGAPAEEVQEVITSLGGVPSTTSPTLTPSTVTSPTSTPSAPASLPRSLDFGFGQIKGISPNLDSAANSFLSLLGGFAEGGEVKKFEKGGSVPRATEIAGQPHMLSYITPDEASILQSLGGSGAPGPGGIPSFFYDEVGAVEGTTGNIGSGGQSQDFGSGEDSSNFSGSGDYNVSTSQANDMNVQATENKMERDAVDGTKSSSTNSSARNERIQSNIDRLNELREGLTSGPTQRESLVSGVSNLLGFGSNDLLSTDLEAQGVTPQSTTPSTSVMGYSGPTGQIQAPASMQSIVPGRDTPQSGISGTTSVATARDTGIFDAITSGLGSVGDYLGSIDVMGPSNTYDMSRMTSR